MSSIRTHEPALIDSLRIDVNGESQLGGLNEVLIK